MYPLFQQRLVALLSLTVAILLSGQLMMRLISHTRHYGTLRQAITHSQERQKELSVELSKLDSQSELYRDCSEGHESLARYAFALKKPEEVYIPLGEDEGRSEGTSSALSLA